MIQVVLEESHSRVRATITHAPRHGRSLITARGR
jgi:hypothetical protein